MTAEEALNTSRPVLFEGPDQETYPYYGTGSALLFTWETAGYVVTAKHVSRQGTAQRLRIPRDDPSPVFFRFERELVPQGDEEDWKDLTFYRVHSRLNPEEWAHLALPLDMAHLRAAAESYRPGLQMWVSGYPAPHRSIDYDAGHIQLTRCIMKGTYETADPSARGKHRIRLDADLESFDGLSGAPVFLQPTPDSMLFGGILIQGSASSRLAHFIGAVPLAAMLSQLPKAAA